MDETSVYFDMSRGLTISQKGEKTVHIKCTDGSKLKPICIFKGKKLPQGQTIPDGVVVWFQEKGWMNSELMEKYIDMLIEDRVNKRIDKEPALMVYDSFSGHL
ncbi:4757_t:CDS:2 [Entrophospora sp. SA101]|nr:4757_t:CDS:2 [Entrophospora sp. SA101]CAJ0837207.1 15751_t:CDS:2 [Entrophospora sp. SA101]